MTTSTPAPSSDLLSQELTDRRPAATRQPDVAASMGFLREAGLDTRLAWRVRELAAAGCVLLRNEVGGDGRPALPLAASEPVALLGRVQKDWIAVGYGSGGDVNVPYLTNLLDSLREAATPVDEEIAALYERWCAAHPVDPGTEWGKWPLSFPEMEIADAELAASAARSRTAVVVVGRAAGEDRESVLEPGSYYLTAAERRLLEQARAHFERVVAVVVTGNVMDLAWAEELHVDALLLAWCGGMEGGRAVADVLTGAAQPGGRLTDTIARRYEDYPSASHFGDLEANEYVEDIFVGYRYFETFALQAVLYPFGYGLSYGRVNLQAGAPEAGAEVVRIPVTATGQGEAPASEIIQVYVAKASGGLSQPARELVGFVRTGELAAGASEKHEITIPWERLASYDDSGMSGHRFAWVLPEGEYCFFVGANVRDAAPVGSVEVAATRVLRQCEQACAPDPAHPFERLAVRDGAVAASEPVPVSEVDLAERIVSRMPAALTAPATPVARFDEVLAGRARLEDFVASLSPNELACLSYGDIVMNSLLGVPGNAGALGGVTEQLRERGIPAVVTTDGPSGLRVSATASLLPCGTALASTWDPAAVEGLSVLYGQEMAALGSDVVLGPGMNIHRDPLCGRNFEYFSEDPLLSGAMGVAVVRGVQAGGKSACPKHFAANNQETNRIYNDSRVSERALREIYLRGFEMVVREAEPACLMTSYNKVNGVWAHYNYDLVTTILRREWGFAGLVVTDWWMRMAPDPLFPALRDSAYRVRAGVDVLMPGGDTHFSITREDAVMDSYQAHSATPASEQDPHAGVTLGEMQDVALHVLRFVAHLDPALARRPQG